MRLCPLSRRHEFPFTLMLKREDLPPPNLLALSSFSSQDSGDFRRHFIFDPARILCVAGYFRCIGDSFPVHVFPATFPVATVSVAISLVCPISSPREVSASCLWWCRFLSSRIFDGVGEPGDNGIATGCR